MLEFHRDINPKNIYVYPGCVYIYIYIYLKRVIDLF